MREGPEATEHERSAVLGDATDRVCEGVYVAGGIEPADGRISWVPATARGLIPINSYVLVDGADCVVVDAGVPAHEAILLGGLEALSSTVQRTKLIITRGVEFETIGNITALLRTHPIDAVFSHFPSSSWFRLDPRFDVEDEGARREAATRFRPLRIGEPIRVDLEGARVLDVLEPALRLLQTVWLYDRPTGTLFTSDAFGYALIPPGATSRIIDEDNDWISLDDVEMGLEPKFGWLRTADVGPTCDAIRSIFETLDVRTIAPGVGCVLRGPRVVSRHVRMVLEILERWSDDHGV
jgi:flavorubredoxin